MPTIQQEPFIGDEEIRVAIATLREIASNTALFENSRLDAAKALLSYASQTDYNGELLYR